MASGLGSSSLKEKTGIMDSFLSLGQENQVQQVEKEKYNIQKGIRLSERQNCDLEDLKVFLGTKNDGEALRYAFDEFFKLKGEEIRELAHKKRSISLS